MLEKRNCPLCENDTLTFVTLHYLIAMVNLVTKRDIEIQCSVDSVFCKYLLYMEKRHNKGSESTYGMTVAAYYIDT